ncbi:MAG: ABC transporter permease [Bacteroidaceae bacterium]|jgi:NitT/TauT family transport system permease protein|nr:ABC transporter permease [Bacteroidaceae bacterium]
MKTVIYTIASFAVTLALWELAVLAGDFDSALFPAPQDVAKAFGEIVANGTLYDGIAASMLRFVIGYLISVVAGIALGLLIGNVNVLFRLTNPVVQMIRPIAPVAWMPFIVLLIGIGDAPAIVIIFLAGFFPVLLTTARGVHSVDTTYLKVASNYGISRLKTVFGIILPAAFPQIANSLHIALGSAWIFLVSGEMVGTQSGLGYMIIDARNNLRPDILLATMIVIGGIGFVLDFLIGKFEKKVLTHYGVY